MKRVRALAVPAALFLVFALDLAAMWRHTPAYDEPSHLRYGYNLLSGRAARFDDSKMPFSALNAAPRAAGRLVRLATGRTVRSFYGWRFARAVTALFSVFVAWLVWRWSRERYGPAAGLLSLFLYALSPEFIANAGFVATDVYAAGMALAAVYAFRAYLKNPSPRSFALAALALGVAQLAKYSCIFLYPILAAIALLREGRRAFAPASLAAFARRAAGFAAVSLLVVNAGFLFDRTGTPLAGYAFKSDVFTSLTARAGPLARAPLPLPYPYLDGLDQVRYRERTGFSYHTYLFGKVRAEGPGFGGFPGYYFVALFFKEPVAWQAFFWWAAALYAARRKRRRFRDEDVFVLVPAAVLAVYFNFFFNTQIGIRFFLPALPFLYVFCGGLLDDADPPGRVSRAAVAALAVFGAASVLSWHPHYLSYFNEAIPDRKRAYEVLADSNLDWGQNRAYLDDYLKRHPEAKFRPWTPRTGRIVIDVNHLVGLFNPDDHYAWLRRLKPVDHVAYSYLVFDVGEKDLPEKG